LRSVISWNGQLTDCSTRKLDGSCTSVLAGIFTQKMTNCD